MFVRWKRRKRPHTTELMRYRDQIWGDTLNACLVENTREGGRVRQRVVRYLGTVNEKLIGLPHISEIFWRDALPRLDTLQLKRRERNAVIEALNSVVPRNVSNGGQS